ncbi:DUF2798 domain-containing protein [Bradyrhizobium sp. 141]|uniref:DUF2798 domain-containing protein n=1 Tax=Bradyrhizobium sp. 141 TaxID=2782617 RepID=UPI001FFB19DB|nr:DUF2798 domain-containing protein [Bradyrhizobium sp. 141]MCK1723118.1 DUF2798 domain-containing protein [Bradyrhizobium sp. 141]
MFAIPRRYSHFVFSVIQSGLTSFIAAGIASYSAAVPGHFLWNWMVSWLVSWVAMAPVVLLAAPAIRSLALALTRDEAVLSGESSGRPGIIYPDV